MELADALGGLKGPIMKVAQILAAIPDALPNEYAKELSKLQAEAPSMGWLFVKRRMSFELGTKWKNNFKYFTKNAVKAASLGQVHKAKDSNYKLLACKLQYPDMNSAISADLKQLKLVMNIYKKLDKAIQPEEIYEELSERLTEELDYKREVKHINLYRDMLLPVKSINIPEPVQKLSTGKLLTMTWLEGKPLNNYYNSNIKTKNMISANLFQAWYLPFYKYGIIHGDPHPGNYTIAKNGNVLNLLDFGCIRIFSSTFVSAVIDLYVSLRDNKEELAVSAYESWGFKNISKEIINILNIWAQYVYGPLLQDKKRGIQENQNGSYGREVASKVHKELKRLGGVKPPREFVLVDRAAIGLGSVFMHLKAELNWHRMCEEMIQDFDIKKLAKRQKGILKRNNIIQDS